MAPLLTIAELSVWAQQEVGYDDQWAAAVLAAASDVVRTAAAQPLWDRATAPARARQIASHLAARTYKNPDSIQSEGGIGPLGGDRYVEELARALHLTDAERIELTAMAPSAGGRGGSLWVQPVAPGEQVVDGDVYLFDHLGSDWGVPYFHPDDRPAYG